MAAREGSPTRGFQSFSGFRDLLINHLRRLRKTRGILQETVRGVPLVRPLQRKLVEKFSFPRRDADQVGAFLRRDSIVAQPADLPPDLCRDPTDIPVLGTAVAGACALLISVDISVDRDLLDMQTIRAIPIIRPGEYWRRTAGID
jgi:predicted nucleic acid-binding protein